MVAALALGITCLGMSPRTFAQAIQTNRLVEYVAPLRLSLDAATDSSVQTNVADLAFFTTPSWGDVLKPKAGTSGDRLVSFEQEYGMGPDSGSTFGKVLQAAKYGLDKMCFTMQEAAKKLEFKYDTADADSGVWGGDAGQPQYDLPVFGRFSHAQVQTVVTVHDPQTGQTFLGVKLSVPFGLGQEAFDAARGEKRPHQPAS